MVVPLFEVFPERHVQFRHFTGTGNAFDLEKFFTDGQGCNC